MLKINSLVIIPTCLLRTKMRLPANTYGTQLIHLLNLLAVCTAILSKVALNELQQVVRKGAVNEAKHPHVRHCLKTVQTHLPQPANSRTVCRAYVHVQWNLSIVDTTGNQLAVLYTVEPLYRGHHWDPAGCPVYSGTSL